MRQYRVEMERGDDELHFFSSAPNEYEAIREARDHFPEFTLTLCVEVLNPEAA